MKRKLPLTVAILFFSWSFNSCSSYCVCEKDLACGILTVKKKNPVPTDTVILTKIFCSQTNYYTDYAVQDSIRSFIDRHTTDTSYVDVRDSIYSHYEPVRTKHNLRRYTDSGYSCACPI